MPHLDEIKDRIANIGQIEGVIVAMRAMAAAHATEARKHLSAIREHEATVARSMAEAMSMAPATEPERPGRDPVTHLQLVVGAAQGFSGLYNERIVTGALDSGVAGERRRFMLVGQRCVSEFLERGHEADWSSNMIAHAAEVPALASRIVDALFARIDKGEVQRVSVVYVDPDKGGQTLVVRTLMPFDFSRIERVATMVPPLAMMAPQLLIARLVEEYVFTEICEALMLGFAAENDARMNAMTRARSNVRRIGEDLQHKFHQARQEETTTEIVELSAAAT